MGNETDFIFKIPELDLYIIFYPSEVKTFDLHTKELLSVMEIPSEYDYDIITKDTGNPYTFLLIKNDEEILHIVYSPLDIKHKIKTNATYILNLGSHENIGFFVGLYEFGTFFILEKELAIQKTISCDSLSYGLLNEQTGKFIVCRGSKGIECWDWNKEKPTLEWQNKKIEVTKGLVFQSNEKIIAGSKQGKIFILDNNGNEESHFELVNEPIRHMIWTDACVSATERNFVYKFTLEGKIIWKTELPGNSPNHSLSYENKKIWLTTYLGSLYVLDNQTGVIEKIITIRKENFSPIAVFVNQWILYTAPENLLCKLLKQDQEKEFSIPFNDKMIRALQSIKNGLLTGDDYGDITLLRRPKVEIKTNKMIKRIEGFDPQNNY